MQWAFARAGKNLWILKYTLSIMNGVYKNTDYTNFFDYLCKEKFIQNQYYDARKL